jgi:flagellar L-ring protein precursor FlgH
MTPARDSSRSSLALAALATLLGVIFLLGLPLRAQSDDSTATDSAAAKPLPPTPPRRIFRPSWTADRRAFQLGDVITIQIDEFTLASATSGNKATDSRKTDATFGVNVPPTFTPRQGSFKTQNNGESQKKGEAQRENRFQGEMSVRVVNVDPMSGLLQVKGTKLINVDKARQFITVSGWVRPQDITASNVVESWRLGDAEVVYTSQGSLDKPKKGLVGRALGWVWP